VRAFDDGAKVYIEFPLDLATSEAPPLFVSDEDGARELVNYRVRNRYYVIDRLFDTAELRLDDTVVTVRKDSGFCGRMPAPQPPRHRDSAPRAARSEPRERARPPAANRRYRRRNAPRTGIVKP
jgi:hypothetical protein